MILKDLISIKSCGTDAQRSVVRLKVTRTSNASPLLFMPPKLTPEQKTIRDAKKREYMRKYDAKRAEQKRIYAAQWRANNPDKCKEQSKRRAGLERTEHQKERARLAQQRYRDKHPDIVAAQLERGKIRRRARYRADEEFREYMKARSRAAMPEVQRKRRAKLKNAVFNHYGKVCACCGETEETFLTIGHVNGDGAEHRRQLKSRSGGAPVYLDIIRKGFPADFRIECYNCNCGAARNGGICPHVRAKLTAVAPQTDASNRPLSDALSETPITASGTVNHPETVVN